MKRLLCMFTLAVGLVASNLASAAQADGNPPETDNPTASELAKVKIKSSGPCSLEIVNLKTHAQYKISNSAATEIPPGSYMAEKIEGQDADGKKYCIPIMQADVLKFEKGEQSIKAGGPFGVDFSASFVDNTKSEIKIKNAWLTDVGGQRYFPRFEKVPFQSFLRSNGEEKKISNMSYG